MMGRDRTAFAERNKIAIAVIGFLVLTMIFLLTFYANSLPGLSGSKHTALFAEAGGIRPGNEVRVAGVKVGEVTDISLQGKVVKVQFRIKGVDLGEQTTAAVKVKTMLGQKYLSISPHGSGTLRGDIPLARTTTPYDVNAALSELSTTVDNINTGQLEKSFNVLSAAFKNTPASVRGVVKGLTGLSRTLSSRDSQLAALFASTNGVTKTLQERNEEFAKIINDGTDLLDELAARRRAVTKMLAGTAQLGIQLRGLVTDNEATLRPALAKLDKVSAILHDNQANLDAALKELGPYYKVLTSATGNGHWIDSYICGLFDSSGAPELQNDVVRNCTPTRGGGK